MNKTINAGVINIRTLKEFSNFPKRNSKKYKSYIRGLKKLNNLISKLFDVSDSIHLKVCMEFASDKSVLLNSLALPVPTIRLFALFPPVESPVLNSEANLENSVVV